MIKFMNMMAFDADVAVVWIHAETKAEVDTNGDDYIPGMPAGRTIGFGSYATTCAGDIGFIKTDGTWEWVGDNSNSRSVSNTRTIDDSLRKAEPSDERRDTAEPIDEIPEEEPVEEEMR